MWRIVAKCVIFFLRPHRSTWCDFSTRCAMRRRFDVAQAAKFSHIMPQNMWHHVLRRGTFRHLPPRGGKIPNEVIPQYKKTQTLTQ